jgi:hypothetical protein
MGSTSEEYYPTQSYVRHTPNVARGFTSPQTLSARDDVSENAQSSPTSQPPTAKKAKKTVSEPADSPSKPKQTFFKEPSPLKQQRQQQQQQQQQYLKDHSPAKSKEDPVTIPRMLPAPSSSESHKLQQQQQQQQQQQRKRTETFRVVCEECEIHLGKVHVHGWNTCASETIKSMVLCKGCYKTVMHGQAVFERERESSACGGGGGGGAGGDVEGRGGFSIPRPWKKSLRKLNKKMKKAVAEDVIDPEVAEEIETLGDGNGGIFSGDGPNINVEDGKSKGKLMFLNSSTKLTTLTSMYMLVGILHKSVVWFTPKSAPRREADEVCCVLCKKLKGFGCLVGERIEMVKTSLRGSGFKQQQQKNDRYANLTEEKEVEEVTEGSQSAQINSEGGSGIVEEETQYWNGRCENTGFEYVCNDCDAKYGKYKNSSNIHLVASFMITHLSFGIYTTDYPDAQSWQICDDAQ